MKKQKYVYFLIFTDQIGPPLAFYTNKKEAERDAKIYKAKVVRHAIQPKQGA